MVVMLFAAVILALQAPRVDRIIYQYGGSAAPFGPSASARETPLTAASLAEQARSQRNALAELDRLEQTARAKGMSLATIRQAISRISVPGYPHFFKAFNTFADFNPEDLLDLPGLEIRSSGLPGSN